MRWFSFLFDLTDTSCCTAKVRKSNSGLRSTPDSCRVAFVLAAVIACSAAPVSASEWGLSFDGVDDIVQISRLHGPYNFAVFHDPIEARTVELQWKANDITKEQVLYDEGGDEDGLAIRIKDGQVQAAARVAYGQTTLGGSYGEIDEWHHVALVFDAGYISLYLDAELLQSADIGSTVIPYRQNKAGLGATNQDAFGTTTPSPDNETSFACGVLDEVRVWSVARSQEEISDNATRPLEGNEPGLEAYWRTEEGTGQLLTDSSPNGRGVFRGYDETEELSDPSWVRGGAPVYFLDVSISAWIEPEEAYTLDDLECVTEVENLGGYPELFYFYRWFRDGEELTDPLEVGGEILPVTESILSHYYTAKNESFFCVAQVSDGTESAHATTDLVTILNSPPSQPEVYILPDGEPRPNDDLGVWLVTPPVDPDGDPVGVMFEWFDSLDGEDWNLRLELSGRLDPYDRGEPEVSKLYTEMAEYWRVEVTPVEFDGEAKMSRSYSAEELAVLGVVGTGESLVHDFYIMPDLNGDYRVDGEDLSVLRSVWHKQKGELKPEVSLLFFDLASPPTATIGAEDLFKFASRGWRMESGE